MAEKDFCLKQLLLDKQRFADLFNGSLFDGRQILNADDLELVPDESGIIFIDRDGSKRTIQRRRDVVMKSSNDVCFAVFACEGQASIHYGMPVRTMLYDALDYAGQLQQIEKEHALHGDLSTSHEFLSHMSKDDRLLPVITLTLYHGKDEYDGAKSLFELLDLPDHDEAAQALIPYLSNYRLNLVNMRNIEDIQKFHTSLQYIFGMLKYNSDKKRLYEYAKEHREEIIQMDSDSVMALFSLLGEQKRLMKLMERTGETRGGFDMCAAIDELIADGESRGELRGEERMTQLVAILLKNQQSGLLESALNCQDIRQKLFQQYGI